MFELSVAFKYLLPRRRQLSVSLIALISMLVISLVVWLIVVFFSVMTGLEKNWVNRLIALTAPVRVTPTEAYYDSYYYRIDGVSTASDFTPKSLNEKRYALYVDPYDPDMDSELPSHWPLPDLNADGSVKDLVGEAFAAFDSIPPIAGLRAEDFEITTANIRLTLLREEQENPLFQPEGFISYISQNSYVSSFDGGNPQLLGTLQDLSSEDLDNILHMMAISPSNVRGDHPTPTHGSVATESFRQRARDFFSHVKVHSLRTPNSGWRLPLSLLPSKGKWKVCAVGSTTGIQQLVVPQKSEEVDGLLQSLKQKGFPARPALLEIQEGQLLLSYKEGKTLSLKRELPIIVAGATEIEAAFDPESVKTATAAAFLDFSIQLQLQGTPIKGTVPYEGLELASTTTARSFTQAPQQAPLWIHNVSEESTESILPSLESEGDGVLLAKHFIKSGVRVGDRGYLSYHTPTASSYQEQRLPIYVAGFYDPGVIPIGGKFVMVSRDVTSMIRSVNAAHGDLQGNGINVWMDDLTQAALVKQHLENAFKERGIDSYWRVETYEEYDFTRAIIQQIRSDKNLWSLMSLIIIAVACSNIVTMLILLVNDKKVEIGILRSMGASGGSIALIFGLCGTVMGMIGSLLGITAALFTLRNLHALLDFIARVQGHELLNSAFFGSALPNEVSLHVLLMVGVTTVVISLVAGLVPAIKASLLKPSAVLRSE